MSGIEIPRTLATLWGRDTAGRRGPRPALTLDRIAAAAVAVADADGLAAVSMKRVAEAVGVSTMALYRYVDSKEDLATVMLEQVIGAPPDVSSRDWRDALAEWCRAYRAVLLAHPWVLQLPLSGPPLTPQQLGWMEAALQATRATGLTGQERLQVLLQVNVFVRGDAALGVALASAAAERADAGSSMSATWAGLVTELADEATFPALRELVADDEFAEDDDPVEQFEFGLQRMLDGVALLVDARTGSDGG
ncbi:MAG: TetR/AcrR family transcriptional regulator [Nocardioidaceae bacterium]